MAPKSVGARRQAGGRSARENSFGAVHELKDYFDGELDLPLWNRRSYQGTRSRTGEGCSVRCKNVGVAVNRAWGSEVRVIENVEHFSAELHVEILRDFFDAVVLENREVQTGYARANQAIAAGIAAKVETLQGSGIDRPWGTRWSGIAIRAPKRRVRSGRNREALGLDVVGRIARIGERLAARPAKPVGICKIVTTVGVVAISARTPCGGKGHTIACGKYNSELPSICDPASRTRE